MPRIVLTNAQSRENTNKSLPRNLPRNLLVHGPRRRATSPLIRNGLSPGPRAQRVTHRGRTARAAATATTVTCATAPAGIPATCTTPTATATATATTAATVTTATFASTTLAAAARPLGILWHATLPNQ